MDNFVEKIKAKLNKAVDGAELYGVDLYKDGELIASVKTAETSVDLSSYKGGAGSYTFKVIAAGSLAEYGEVSEMSAESPAKAVNSAKVKVG